MKGEWPKEDIDHKNNIRDDNRWTNLREAKNSINQENLHKPYKNNRSGFLGVSIDNGKYYAAKIQVNKKQYRIGIFHTPELAHAAYVKTKRKLHRGCSI